MRSISRCRWLPLRRGAVTTVGAEGLKRSTLSKFSLRVPLVEGPLTQMSYSPYGRPGKAAVLGVATSEILPTWSSCRYAGARGGAVRRP